MTDGQQSRFKELFGSHKPRNLGIKLLALYLVVYLGFVPLQNLVMQNIGQTHSAIIVFVSTILLYGVWLVATYIIDLILASRGY